MAVEMTGVTSWLVKEQLLILYLVGITAPRYTVVTFHEDEKSWNDAQMICMTTGGYLYREDSREKATVLKTFKTKWLQNPELIWIGLHSFDVNGSLQWTYGMDNCYEVKHSVHSAWYTNESTITKLCGAYDSQTELWYKASCKINHEFVCERQTADTCIFSESSGNPLPSISDDFLTEKSHSVDHLDCQNKCLRFSRRNMECWAVKHNETSTICTLYITEDQFLFQNNSNIENTSLPFYLKVCYESARNSTISGELSTSTTPDEGCRPNKMQSPNTPLVTSTLSPSAKYLDFATTNIHTPTSNPKSTFLDYINTTALPGTTTLDNEAPDLGLQSPESYKTSFSALVVSTLSAADMARNYTRTTKTKHKSSVLTKAPRHVSLFNATTQKGQSSQSSLRAGTSLQTTFILQLSTVSTQITTQDNLMSIQLKGVETYSVFDSPVFLSIVSSVSGFFVVGAAALAAYVLTCRGRSSSG